MLDDYTCWIQQSLFTWFVNPWSRLFGLAASPSKNKSSLSPCCCGCHSVIVVLCRFCIEFLVYRKRGDKTGIYYIQMSNDISKSTDWRLSSKTKNVRVKRKGVKKDEKEIRKRSRGIYTAKKNWVSFRTRDQDVVIVDNERVILVFESLFVRCLKRNDANDGVAK